MIQNCPSLEDITAGTYIVKYDNDNIYKQINNRIYKNDILICEKNFGIFFMYHYDSNIISTGKVTFSSMENFLTNADKFFGKEPIYNTDTYLIQCSTIRFEDNYRNYLKTVSCKKYLDVVTLHKKRQIYSKTLGENELWYH